MIEILTGYQWGDDLSFIGPYQFQHITRNDVVDLPPRTTLTPPPASVAPGHEAAWDVATGDWIVRIEDLSWMATEHIEA